MLSLVSPFYAVLVSGVAAGMAARTQQGRIPAEPTTAVQQEWTLASRDQIQNAGAKSTH